MRVVVIGGTGHIGSYLVPRLVRLGHDVVSISRGEQQPYEKGALWRSVTVVHLDRDEEDRRGSFGATVAGMDPQVVIDLICYTPESAEQLVNSLRDRILQFIHCGTIWIYGHSTEVPTTESQPRCPFGEYGIRKAKIEDYLLTEARQRRFPASVLHPGHIVGRGWFPLNPAGNFNPDVFRKLARGEPVLLPNLGLETVHHVHADDVAQAFERAMTNWSGALGESFHVVSDQALTLRGYAEAVSAWFGRRPELQFVPWEKWREVHSEEDSLKTWDHIAHSPNCSIAKARTRLGYQPRFSSLEAVLESLGWLLEQGKLG